MFRNCRRRCTRKRRQKPATVIRCSTRRSTIRRATDFNSSAVFRNCRWRCTRNNEPLFLGTLAAGGTLGILIPPSINMIIYGVMTDTSVPKLYLAGFIPGFVLTVLFSLTVLIACLWRPRWGGEQIPTNWEARMRTLPDLIPPLALLMIVVGAIFFGLATATESAAVGIIGALAITAWRRRLSLAMLRDVCEATVRTTA